MTQDRIDISGSATPTLEETGTFGSTPVKHALRIRAAKDGDADALEALHMTLALVVPTNVAVLDGKSSVASPTVAGMNRFRFLMFRFQRISDDVDSAKVLSRA
jgi:hypothetical protein